MTAIYFFSAKTRTQNHDSIQTSFNSKNLDRCIGITVRDAHRLHFKRAVLAAAGGGASGNVQPAADSRAWTDRYVDPCGQPLRNLPEHHHPIDFDRDRRGRSAHQFRP